MNTNKYIKDMAMSEKKNDEFLFKKITYDISSLQEDSLVIVGIGNIGNQYKNNRHNAGFMLSDFLIDILEKIHSYSSDGWVKKFGGRYQLLRCNFLQKTEKKIYFAQSDEYVNASGGIVNKIMKYYNIHSKNLLVLYDDLELPFGTFALKFGGGAGGHNGLRSITSAIGTPDYHRLRIGIGHPTKDSISHMSVGDYVLSDFNHHEKRLLADGWDFVYRRLSDMTIIPIS